MPYNRRINGSTLLTINPERSRRINYRLIFLFLIFLLVSLRGAAFSQEDTIPSDRLVIFYSPSCHKCSRIKNELIPKIEKEFKGKIRIEYRDTSDMQNYSLMLGLKEKYDKNMALVLPVFYLKGSFLNGNNVNINSLRKLIAVSLAKTHKERSLPPVDLVNYFKAFKPLAVLGAGLIDGINPCAFTVMVFFISFLALQGYKKRELIAIGLSFILAVFLTYLILGLGIFSFLYRLRGFLLLVKVFNFSIGIISVILGGLCLYDFFQFRKTYKSDGLILQLPRGIKNQIHKVIGEGFRVTETKGRHILRLSLAALITGFLVSLLEAVCTGQLYLPTIAFVLKTTSLKFQALAFLLLYNFMFIVPLLIIFLLALLGTTSEAFADFLKRHLPTIKFLMAVLFFSLGIFLIRRN